MSDFINALDAEIADLEHQLSSSHLYVKLRRAQELRDAYVNLDVGNASPAPARDASRPARPSASGASASIVDAVRSYLQEKQVPVPTRELMDVLARNGIQVGGVTPKNSVSSLLSKTPDIVSHGRKGWTLNRGMEKADDASPNQATSPASFSTSAPVEPGGEVAHDNTVDLDDLL